MFAKRSLCFFLWAMVSINLVSATDYYINNNHLLANDTNQGTFDLPLKTIQRCANIARAGDTCLIYPGSYDERVSMNNSGFEGSPITFEAVGSVKVRAFTFINKSYITIKNFEITHKGLTKEGIGTASTSVYLRNASHLNILNNTIHDTIFSCLQSHYWKISEGVISQTASSDNIIRGNTVFKCGAQAGIASAGITIYGHRNIMENNDISRSGGDFTLVTGGDFNVVRNNVWRDNHQTDAYWNNTNHIDGLQHWCIAGGLSTRRLLIENNTMYNATSPDTHFTIFQDQGAGCDSHEILIRYNTVRNIGNGFIINDNRVSAVRIYHNSALNTSLASNPWSWTGVTFSDYAKTGEGATYGKSTNNIFYNTVRNWGNENWAQPPNVTINRGDSTIGFYADYNLGYNSNCTSSCRWYNPKPGIGQENHSILNKDPLFVDTSRNNFNLQAESPAIDKGGPLTNVSDSDSGSGTILVVQDAGYFQDGWAGISADWIAVGNTSNSVQITSIDYNTNTILISNPLNRNKGDPVWLYKDSNGRRVLYGNAPDIGAYEYYEGNSSPPIIDTPLNFSESIVHAASCSFTDVQTAVTRSNPEDVVIIPEGTCVWDSLSSLTLNKSITLQGAGSQTTRIIHDSNLSTIIISPSSDVSIRVSGVYFDKVNNLNAMGRAITVVGSKRGDLSLTKIRIDHNTFNKGGRQIYWTGWAYGLTDHNTFINGNIAIGFTGDNNHSWKRPIRAGSADAVFVEDNLFIIDNNADREPNHQIYHQEGYRTVIRNNLFNASTYNRTDCDSGISICYANFFDSHGNLNMYTGTNSDMRGQPIIEVYNNTFHAYRAYNHMAIRGGSVLIHNNKFSCDNSPCTSKNIIRFEEEESWTDGGPFPTKPATTIWPAQDQIANSFLWDNTYNGILITNISLTAPNEPFFIREGRDYWMHEPQSTGGKTIYTDRPGGNETFVEGPQAYYPYVPYQYPHPLSQISDDISEPVSEDNADTSSSGTSNGGGGGESRIETLDSLSSDSAGNINAGTRQGLDEDEEKELTPKEIEKMIEEENIKEAFNTQKASYAKVILYGFLGMVFFAIVIVGFLIIKIIKGRSPRIK